MSTQGVVWLALERVNDLLKRETAAAAAVKGVLDRAVEELNSDLGAVADTVSLSSDAERNRRVRELAYDIEDSVEFFVGSNASKWSGSYLRCLFKYCSSERRFVEDLHVFSRKARVLMMTTGSSTENLPSEELQVSMDDQPPVLDTNNPDQDVVGVDDYILNLKMHLLGAERGFSVIAVCGMGGIGKTTLARSVFDDPSVIYNFACRAWVTVSQDYNSREVLLTLLSSVSPDNSKKRLAAVETGELTEMLFKFLYMRRYLICLDDLWSREAWDSLRVVFPNNNNGSRILITTRNMDVAHYTSSRTIQMQLLGEEESLQLLKKSGQWHHLGASNPRTAEIAKQIARSCNGLPLAITLVGQILSRTREENWELILKNLSSQSNEKEKLTRSALELSYNYLPFRLKPCFLYMGHFPPDETILADKLHLLWMAEGLISKTNEAAGQEYLEDLVNRSLVHGVETEDLFASSKFKSVGLHDLIRDLCISIGKEEEFFEVIDFFRATIRSIYTCRLAVYLDKYKDTSDVILIIPDAKRIRIRSIFFYETVESMLTPAWPSEFADLSSFPRIRVLDFNGVDFRVKRLPRGIEKLIYLRYLSFNRCYLEEFPSSFGSFSFLETLDLRVIDSCIMTIPNVLRKLTRLRHLYFPLAFQCDGCDKLKLDLLTSLQVVENFNADSCDVEDLIHLQHLEILKVIMDGSNQDSQDVINNLKKMNSIRRSSFVVRRFDSYSQRRLSTVKILLESDAVHAVDIEGHLRPLPTDVKLGFNLTEMEFSESEFSEHHMKILGEHPNLKTLVLRNDAFVEPHLVFSEMYFPQLTSLKLATLQYLESWEVESGAMPSLAILTIEQCDKLEMISSELTEIWTLKKLKIGSMPLNFQSEVKGIIEEAMELGNEEISVTFYDC